MSLFNLDIESLIKTVGMIGVIAIVFAESGLLIGFFLPGDSLLFVAGFLASQHYMNIHTLVLLVAIAAISGSQSGPGRKQYQKPGTADSHARDRVDDACRKRGHCGTWGLDGGSPGQPDRAPAGPRRYSVSRRGFQQPQQLVSEDGTCRSPASDGDQ